MTRSEQQTGAGSKKTAKKARPAGGRKAGQKSQAVANGKDAGTARPGTKTAKILDLLKRPHGATLKEIMKATRWQAHSVRGFLSGTLRKKLGLRVDSAKHDHADRTYRVSSK